MKLVTKLLLLFLVMLLLCVPLVYFGVPAMLMNVVFQQVEKQAKTFSLFLLDNVKGFSVTSYIADEPEYESAILHEFEKAKIIGEQSKSFFVEKIILVNPDFKVEIEYPEPPAGESTDYSTHKDIADCFRNKDFTLVLEPHIVNGKAQPDIDIVAFLTIGNDQPRVLEIKMSFEATMAILQDQYLAFELLSMGIVSAILFAIMAILFLVIRRTAIKPAIAITKAMEEVGNGELDTSMPVRSKDEFGTMAHRFNEMVKGLKEKFHLSKYVSQSTLDAVKTAIDTGRSFHTPERKRLTVLFSDIRGFTAYSEKRDPAHIIRVLNSILGVQAKIVLKHGGDIDKFVGDETMATFGDPVEAVKTAIEIQKTLAFNAPKIDGLKLGIGVVSGNVVQGDVGSDQMKDFTVIGDTVNTASRLQALAAPGEILIAGTLADDPAIRKAFALEERGSVKLKGKETEIELFRVTYG